MFSDVFYPNVLSLHSAQSHHHISHLCDQMTHILNSLRSPLTTRAYGFKANVMRRFVQDSLALLESSAGEKPAKPYAMDWWVEGEGSGKRINMGPLVRQERISDKREGV